MEQVKRTITFYADCAGIEAEESFEAFIDHIGDITDYTTYNSRALPNRANDAQVAHVAAELEAALENTDIDTQPTQWWALFHFLCDMGVEGFESPDAPRAHMLKAVRPKVIKNRIVAAQQVLTIDIQLHSDEHERVPNMCAYVFEVSWPDYPALPHLRFLSESVACSCAHTEYPDHGCGIVTKYDLYL